MPLIDRGQGGATSRGDLKQAFSALGIGFPHQTACAHAFEERLSLHGRHVAAVVDPGRGAHQAAALGYGQQTDLAGKQGVLDTFFGHGPPVAALMR